jgi:hypothetical protein
MPSFANKVRGNADYKAAAKAMDLKPKEVKSREAYQRVKAYAKENKPAQAPTASSAPPVAPGRVGGGGQYSPATPGGSYVNAGVGIIGDLLNKFGNNETLAGLGVGSLFDIGKTQANTGMAIAYNDAFLGSLGNFQSGQENLKTANTMKLMGVEGSIARDMIAQQGQEQRLGYQEQGRQERETLGQKGLEERKMRADARGAIRSQGARFYG